MEIVGFVHVLDGSNHPYSVGNDIVRVRARKVLSILTGVMEDWMLQISTVGVIFDNALPNADNISSR